MLRVIFCNYFTEFEGFRVKFVMLLRCGHRPLVKNCGADLLPSPARHNSWLMKIGHGIPVFCTTFIFVAFISRGHMCGTLIIYINVIFRKIICNMASNSIICIIILSCRKVLIELYLYRIIKSIWARRKNGSKVWAHRIVFGMCFLFLTIIWRQIGPLELVCVCFCRFVVRPSPFVWFLWFACPYTTIG